MALGGPHARYPDASRPFKPDIVRDFASLSTCERATITAPFMSPSVSNTIKYKVSLIFDADEWEALRASHTERCRETRKAGLLSCWALA
jgi:hypothetical protein